MAIMLRHIRSDVDYSLIFISRITEYLMVENTSGVLLDFG